jgi:FKBP-type peptidyl-prolyl cis-trans isomerase
MVSVHYKGMLPNGKVLIPAMNVKKPIDFKLAKVKLLQDGMKESRCYK